MRAVPKIGHGRKAGAAATRQLLFNFGLSKPLHLAKAEAKRTMGAAIALWLERTVPIAQIDIDGMHLDAMRLRVAHDLRRRIEAHGLAVEQRAGEDLGMKAFEPGRDIDEEREARGMRKGKAVVAEAFDLLEATPGEIRLVAVPDHAGDEFLFEAHDVAIAAECGHGAAQAIGFSGREARGDHGDLHRLLLEERHTVGPPQHFFEAARILGRLKPHAAAEIGMHHVALDWSRPHDRHLDNEIEEFPRLEPRQHAHLRAAFHLEDAD